VAPVAPGDDDGITAEERMRRAAEQSEQARVASERARPAEAPAANVG
jgi:hypothetical protein